MNKKFFIKNFLILCFALLISGRLAYGHFSHIQEQDKKVSHLCSEIEEIRLSHRTMDWKPTGNDVLDKIKKEAPVGFSSDVHDRLHALELLCRNGFTQS